MGYPQKSSMFIFHCKPASYWGTRFLRNSRIWPHMWQTLQHSHGENYHLKKRQIIEKNGPQRPWNDQRVSDLLKTRNWRLIHDFQDFPMIFPWNIDNLSWFSPWIFPMIRFSRRASSNDGVSMDLGRSPRWRRTDPKNLVEGYLSEKSVRYFWKRTVSNWNNWNSGINY